MGFGGFGSTSWRNRSSRMGNPLSGMSGLFRQGVQLRDVQVFFNSYLILKKTFDAEMRFLDRMGSYIVNDANRSMRKAPFLKRKGHVKREGSTPGRPPYARKGGLKKFNYWFVDPTKEHVRCGPALFQGARNPVPGVHELGLTATLVRKRRRGGVSRKRVKYDQRPYMFPALKKNDTPKTKWKIRNSIKR